MPCFVGRLANQFLFPRCKIGIKYILSLLAADFTITKSFSSILPKQSSTFGLCLKGQWYQLDYTKIAEGLNAVDRLDVSILEDHVFKSKLNIHDSKTDKQLSFLKGSVPCEILEAEVEVGVYDAVFTVHPCLIQHVFDVAVLATIART